jgi:hypothetical protein
MRQSWRIRWKANGASASLGLKILALLMAVYLFADQVTSASSTYLAMNMTETESGKEAGTRAVTSEEILPHCPARLALEKRHKNVFHGVTPSAERLYCVNTAPTSYSNRELQSLSSCLRC